MGYRPGAGRPRMDGKPPLTKAQVAKYDDPKVFLLDIMNDPEVDLQTKVRAAGLALPYCCQRVAEQRVGKKELEAEAANAATESKEWGDDLKVATSQQH